MSERQDAGIVRDGRGVPHSIHHCPPPPTPRVCCPQYGLGEDVYDDDRAAAEKKSRGSEPANGPRVMSGTVQTVVTDRSKM